MKLAILHFIICFVLNSWVTHTEPNYLDVPLVYHESEIVCRSDSSVKSVRNVGHPSDITISTVSLFGSTYLSGNMSQVSANVPSYSGTFSSFVTTPPGAVTFYTLPNYGGLSICLKPSNGYKTYWEWDISQVGLRPGQVKSIKFGCESSNVHYSSPMTVGKEGY